MGEANDNIVTGKTFSFEIDGVDVSKSVKAVAGGKTLQDPQTGVEVIAPLHVEFSLPALLDFPAQIPGLSIVDDVIRPAIVDGTATPFEIAITTNVRRRRRQRGAGSQTPLVGAPALGGNPAGPGAQRGAGLQTNLVGAPALGGNPAGTGAQRGAGSRTHLFGGCVLTGIDYPELTPGKKRNPRLTLRFQPASRSLR